MSYCVSSDVGFSLSVFFPLCGHLFGRPACRRPILLAVAILRPAAFCEVTSMAKNRKGRASFKRAAGAKAAASSSLKRGVAKGGGKRGGVRK